jgi:hypothetical protein
MENSLSKVVRMTDKLASLKTVTIRAQSAYFLAAAESVFFAAVLATDPGANYARDSLASAWTWIEGTQISADDLYAFLENENDTGLMVFGYEARSDPAKSAAWATLITAIMYVVWQAYRAEDAKYVPQTIESVDETIVHDLCMHAERTGKLDQQFLHRLMDYLLRRHVASNGDKLGRPVLREELVMLKNQRQG